MEITPITLHYLFGVNSYLVKTDREYFLVDTGIEKKRGQLEKELMVAGCQSGNLKLIIITHGHLDHVGNATYLRDKYRAEIAMHEGDKDMVESGDILIDMRGGGILIGIVGIFMKILGLRDYEKFTPDIFLEDNQDLSAYGLDATVIHTPGHSTGSISILTAEGDLFCGDISGNTRKPEKTSIIEDSEKLDASIEKFRALKISTVYPGHGKPFKMEQITE